MEERLFIKGSTHDLPALVVTPNTKRLGYPCLLLLHGFLSFKDGDGFLLKKIAERLADAGIASIRMDFCSMGENRYSRRYYGLEECINETRELYHWAQSNRLFDPNQIGLLGHSMGGKVVCCCADLNSKVIVTLNGAVSIEKGNSRFPFDKDELMEKGHIIVSTSDGRDELLFPKFVADSLKYQANDDIYRYKGKLLVCVGKNDPTVSPEVSYQFFQNCPMEEKTMIIIENANHTFNAKTRDYTKLMELCDQMIPWLEKNLCEY